MVFDLFEKYLSTLGLFVKKILKKKELTTQGKALIYGQLIYHNGAIYMNEVCMHVGRKVSLISSLGENR